MNSFVLSEDEDEDTVTLLLPDENDHVWSVRTVSKEEARAIFVNARKSVDSVDKCIITNNSEEYAVLMADEIQKDLEFESFVYRAFCIFAGLLFVLVIVSFIVHLFDRDGYY